MLDSESVPLAAIAYQRGFDVDGLLLTACAELRSLGLRVGGIIQRSSGDPGRCASQVHVVDLRSGESFNIWEDRGTCAHGCRLDERGLIDAEPSIMRSLADGVDLIVINRFGRAESLGRGLIACFMAAIDSGVPVLTAVRPPYDEAWRAFHGGCARTLLPELPRVVDWATTVSTDGCVVAPARCTHSRAASDYGLLFA